MRWIRAFAATSPLMDLLGAVVIALVLLVARGRDQSRPHDHRLVCVAFAFALFKAYEPVKRLGNVYQLFVQAAGVSQAGFCLHRYAAEVMEAPGAKVLAAVSRNRSNSTA